MSLQWMSKGPFVRKRRDVVLQVKDGIVQPDPEQDVAMVSVLERFGRNGNKSLAFCSGWKLKKGAMASSAAPDDNNLVVMGVSAEDMSIAANYVIEQGGGQVVVADGEIVEFLPLPVGGIVSDAEPEEIRAQEEKDRPGSKKPWFRSAESDDVYVLPADYSNPGLCDHRCRDRLIM